MLQIPKKTAEVNYENLEPEIEKIGPAVVEYFGKKGLNALVTSAFDGEHSKHSAHYKGRGLDLRSRGIRAPQSFCLGLQKVLAPLSEKGNYFIVWEGDHVHLEWCPKGEIPNIVGYKLGKFFYDATTPKKTS